jgi:predicted O-methyltransferase YrrM/tetratricopeptide (TPR) repeat protein
MHKTHRMLVEINRKKYCVNSNEFNTILGNKYSNLSIYEGVGEMERLCSLLGELTMQINKNIVIYNPTHGGYIPINIVNKYDTIYLLCVSSEHTENIEKNIQSHNVKNIKWELDTVSGGCVVYADKIEDIDMDFMATHHPIIVAPYSPTIVENGIFAKVFELSNTKFAVYVPYDYIALFYENLSYYIKNEEKGEVLEYDNLIHLCIMVKNGGEQFEQMLQSNMHLIDRWTILDTGSTDNTVDVIKRTLVGKKKGQLFEEPFINFRDSRNRLLELAGGTCKYTLMLDDTYVVVGDLRGFLNEVRGDQASDSFTIFIKGDDMEYGSNRILKTDRQFKYLYRIHEIVQFKNNMNMLIPIEYTHIMDKQFSYMEERTLARKQLDIRLLQEEIDEDPNNPRAYYYMAQTYNIIENYEKSFAYFMERANHPVDGFMQEKIDAIFEAARCANFKLNKPWAECEALYKRAYELDKNRPDSVYFLGIHYFNEGDRKTAYEYFKLAAEIGYPTHCQYSLKPTLSFHFLPKYLAQLCYEFKNYVLGEQCTRLFLEKNVPNADQYSIMASWYAIFVKLNQMNIPLDIKRENTNKPILCFVADGGFEPWTGADILTKGVGGSETYIIEMARYIQKQGQYNVLVFCNCIEQTMFEGVEYIPIIQFMPFAKTQFIHQCIISRFSEYIPVAIDGNVENIYVVLHDLTPSGVVIPFSNKLKQIFCLSEWHVEYFTQFFPHFKDIAVPFYYGIDIERFNDWSYGLKIHTDQHDARCMERYAQGHHTTQLDINNERVIETEEGDMPKSNIHMSVVESSPKIPYKFIYSSYPNRGLYELLQLWPAIVEKYPEATLHIYSDVNGSWVNKVEPVLMQKIRDLYSKYENLPGGLHIYVYGWVNKETLAEAWKTSEYWFYPCTFMETFCLTALEAALSKTLAITNGLAALRNTVGNRGICIEGDASSQEWKDRSLTELFSIMENREHREDLVEKNYEWAKTMSWENQAYKLMDQYINKYNLEYRGMYNWMHDLPKGTNAKMRFEKAIEYYLERNAKETQHWVLEVGVYAGTSLIEIVRKIPNSFGLGVDRWENYNEENIDILQNIEQNGIENVFYRNIRTAGLEDRIKGIKGQSADILLELIRNDMSYDFIYVDGSHRCLDVYLDLYLAWQLLRKGGVMAIDDYTYHIDKVSELPYEYPYEAVNYFLSIYKGKYKLIDMDYRVFLEKL